MNLRDITIRVSIDGDVDDDDFDAINDQIGPVFDYAIDGVVAQLRAHYPELNIHWEA